MIASNQIRHFRVDLEWIQNGPEDYMPWFFENGHHVMYIGPACGTKQGARDYCCGPNGVWRADEARIVCVTEVNVLGEAIEEPSDENENGIVLSECPVCQEHGGGACIALQIPSKCVYRFNGE